MPKFKPARKKARGVSPSRASGISCMVMMFSGFVLLLLFLYFVMKYANQ
ncbi:MAG: hypothetical protein ACE15B_17220 [Bryobacteraceae bacterium]